MDEVLKAMPEKDRKDIPERFSFSKLFQLLGLRAIVATGSSTRVREDGSYHMRSFAYTPQGRKGVLTLSGGSSSRLLLLDYAPPETDFALEFPLHLKEVAQEFLPETSAMLTPSDRADFEKQLATPIPPLGLTFREMLEKLDARVAIAVLLHPSRKFQPSPDAPAVPVSDGLIVIERLGWLVEALKPHFLPMLSQPGAPFHLTDENGVLTVRMKNPAGPGADGLSTCRAI